MAGPPKARLSKGEREVGSSCAKAGDKQRDEGDDQRIWETTRDLAVTLEKDARRQENEAETHNDEGDWRILETTSKTGGKG